MRKLFKMGIVTCLLCCLLASTVYAGNSSFGSTKVKYQTLSNGTELTSTSSRNTKATTNAKWFYYVTAISFPRSTDGTLGMMHVPGLYSHANEIYQAKGEAQWTKTTFSYLDYAGWLSGQGKAGTTYTLCVRLDNLFRSGYGYTQGAWNSN